MNNLKYLITTVTSLLLNGCTFANSNSMPYPAWHLGFSAPDYMEVWIETADVYDIKGRLYPRAMSGTAAILTPPNNSGDPKGWPQHPGAGKNKRVLGADLANEIHIRWQSLVEPQTYLMIVKIPEITRQIMRKREKIFCAFDGKLISSYRDFIIIMLAPGGIAKVWVGGGCMTPIEVTKVRAIIDPRGPYEGTSGGKHRPLSPVSKAYVEKFGIPYDSWK